MILFYISSSLFVALVCYTVVSLRERSFVNVFTPLYAVFVPTNYLADIFAVSEIGPSATPYAYFMNYLTYAAFLGMTTVGYLCDVPAFRLRLSSSGRTVSTRASAYIFLALAIALYAPVLSQFKGDIFNPRAIYEQTRSGFGINFFLSTTLCYLGLILFFFQKSSRIESFLFTLTCVLFLWLHGSKGHILGVLFILAMYHVYVKRRRVSFSGLGYLALGLTLSVTIMFLVTSPGVLLNSGGLMNLVGYSSYSANAMIVVDSNLSPLDGQLTLEQQLYARLPRVLDPDKPHDFGDFYLAKRFFPAEFEADVGAPSFGYGSMFADFGAATPVLLGFAGLINGLIMKSFMKSLRRFPGPGEFILVLFAAGIPLIPIVNSFLVFETVGLGIIANLIQRIRLFGPRRAVRSMTAVGSVIGGGEFSEHP